MSAALDRDEGTHAKDSFNEESKRRKSNRNKKNRSPGNKRYEIRSMFKAAKELERKGQWGEALKLFNKILSRDPHDSHTHLALARLEARRERSKQGSSKARAAFERGVEMCPNNVHILQSWAMYEQSSGNREKARTLYQRALQIDEWNPYVNHAYGLMESNLGNTKQARVLWEKALVRSATAALVCSLGERLIAIKDFEGARELYKRHLPRLQTERERTEVYLASAWLEEKHYANLEGAEEFINLALIQSPGNSRAHVALARLEGRMHHDGTGKDAAVRRLANACINFENDNVDSPEDGRLFNAWANLEVKAGRLRVARKVLLQGMQRHPRDQSLFQAAGKVEERVGNYTGARQLYGASMSIEPSAPALVAYAMLELRHPEEKPANFTRAKMLFQEALLVDPRHGPAYNAYGNMELRRGNVDKARYIFKRGVRAQCSNVASVFHGWAKLELSRGEVEAAREILFKGIEQEVANERGMDSSNHQRSVFLPHTLGMLELNSNRAADALDVFQDGIARHGDSSQLLLGAALCEVKLGKDEGARNLFRRSVDADKTHAQAWQAWGVMEMRAGKFRKARKLFEEGIRNAPKHGALWTSYASMEAKMGHVEVARTLFAAGLKQCPEHVSLYQGWSSLEMREGNYAVAKKLISDALTRDKTRGSGWLIAARIEELQGNDGLVNLILRRGIECAPSHAELYCALGDYQVQHGKYQDARQILEEGLEVNPLYAPLYHSLAELEARLFNLDGLAKLNKRAEELFNKNAMTTSLSTTRAFGKKIQNSRGSVKRHRVPALSQRIGDDFETTRKSEESETSSAEESMAMVEDELVEELLSDSEVITEVEADETNTTAR